MRSFWLFLSSLPTTSNTAASNAANHPPPRPAKEFNSHRAGGRVHWLVRVRDWDIMPGPPPTALGVTRHPPRPAKGNTKRGPRVGGERLMVKEPRAVDTG